jgi:hypothetical protein
MMNTRVLQALTAKNGLNLVTAQGLKWRTECPPISDQ